MTPLAKFGCAFAEFGVGLEEDCGRAGPVFFGGKVRRAAETCGYDDDIGVVLKGECFGGECCGARIHGGAHDNCGCAFGLEDTLRARGGREDDGPTFCRGGIPWAIAVVESFGGEPAAFTEEERVGEGGFRGAGGFDGADCPDLSCAGREEVGGGGTGAEGVNDNGHRVVFACVATAAFAGDEVPDGLVHGVMVAHGFDDDYDNENEDGGEGEGRRGK